MRLRIREGLVRDELITLGRKENRTADEEIRLVMLKQDMAERLLAAPAEQVYDVVVDVHLAAS